MGTDAMHCMDAERLLRWIMHDLERGSALGIVRPLFFVPKTGDPFRLHRYGTDLETPVGVAAGPHTQLAQNIIAAWLTGARYIELKTIQVLDELEVAKPCIDMGDEGYNCEWSQELKLEKSYQEYLNAWVLLHILHDALGFEGKPGFLFNMSAGYDLEGIHSPGVQNFLDRMTDCAADVAGLTDRLASVYPGARALDIPGCMSRSLTVSCMHGCPPNEVERIALYFIEQRRFHTTLKLNPTLLGAESVRDILNKRLGYPTQVPDVAFEHDLRYDDALGILKNCLNAAERAGVTFSIKLTNTLETSNTHQNLPRDENMVYMSGRALHPISVALAARLQKDFDGGLDVSFSAGVDAFNLLDVLACGLAPVTVCSDLLKPGGYGRLSQYMQMLEARMRGIGVSSIAELMLAGAEGKTGITSDGVCDASCIAAAIVKNLKAYAERVTAPRSRYVKTSVSATDIKTKRPLARFDCVAAPCMTACPTEQNIPGYLERAAHGDAQGAWRIIMDTNPFPNVQGRVCDHKCQIKCTRINYDAPLLIREIKRFAAEQCAHMRLAPAVANGRKVAVIGAGPSGLTCAHYLALAGCSVSVYEAKDRVGGMAEDAIPAFRLDPLSLKRDVGNILALGVTLHRDTLVDKTLFTALRAQNDAVYVAVGAQKSMALGVPGEDAQGVFDQLGFLSAVRRGTPPDLGRRVLVVGGGNSAMDVARTALRLGADVTLVYRRTCAQMPCEPEELEHAVEEGVHLLELAKPERVVLEQGRVVGLEIRPMKLECLPPDALKGQRPRPVPCGEPLRIIPADSIIVSIGQKVRPDILEAGDGIRQPALWTQNVLIGGDAARGAATLIEAIGDGRHAADAILQRLGVKYAHPVAEDTRHSDVDMLRVRQARRNYGPGVDIVPAGERINFEPFVKSMDKNRARAEAGRCLQCDTYCGICVTVCPNRANITVETPPLSYMTQEAVREGNSVHILTLAESTITQSHQIINVGDFCNECGNCTTFCPTAGAPYRDKPRLHISKASFENAQDGFYFSAPGVMEGKQRGKTRKLQFDGLHFLYENDEMRVEMEPVKLEARHVTLRDDLQRVTLADAVEAALVYKLISNSSCFLRDMA